MIEDFYVSCTRKRPGTSTVNAKYEYQQSYADTTINGYLGSRSNSESNVGGKYTVTTEYKFYTDDFSMLYGDIIYYENGYYRVISVPQNTAHLSHHMKVMVEKIEGVT